MHRDIGGLFKDLPLYIYNMWVYACTNPSSKDPLAEFMLQLDFHASYGGPSRIRVQRLSLVPRIPQLEGVYIPSPDVNPHIMSLIKLILFKPFHSMDDVDDKGNPQEPSDGWKKSPGCSDVVTSPCERGSASILARCASSKD